MHGFLTFLFLINGYWVPLILNLPLLVWNIKKYARPCQFADMNNCADWDVTGSLRTPIFWMRPKFSAS